MQTTIYSIYIYIIYLYIIYIYVYLHISISIAQLSWVAGCNQETSGNSMGVLQMSVSMRLYYRYIYTIAIYRPHLQEFTGKI